MCVENHLETLRRKHRALDETIIQEQLRPGHCPLKLVALKREKLRLKEKIFQIERKPLFNAAAA